MLKILKIVVLITICFIFLQLSLDNTLTRWLRFVDDVLEHNGNDNCITVKAELQWKSPSPTNKEVTTKSFQLSVVFRVFVPGRAGKNLGFWREKIRFLGFLGFLVFKVF